MSVEGYWFSKSVPYPPRPSEREGNDESPLGAFSRGSTLVRSLLAARLHVTRSFVGPLAGSSIRWLDRPIGRSIDHARALVTHSQLALSIRDNTEGGGGRLLLLLLNLATLADARSNETGRDGTKGNGGERKRKRNDRIYATTTRTTITTTTTRTNDFGGCQSAFDNSIISRSR